MEGKPVPAWTKADRQVARVVIRTALVPKGAAALRLPDVFDHPEWRAAVPDSHSLVELPWSTFTADPDTRVLSYRWKTVLNVRCVGHGPGEPELEERMGEQEWALPIDFVQALPLAAGPLWVDFLCHMQQPARLEAVLAGMGTLYASQVCLPLYLHLYDGTQQLSDLEEALNRGWIFQEVAWGPLDRAVVAAFVKGARQQKHAVLAKLVRRRPSSASALLERYESILILKGQDAVTKLNIVDQHVRGVAPENDYKEKFSKIYKDGKKIEVHEQELEKIIDLIAGPQSIDITKPLVAFCIIQAFARSEFSVDRDSVFATLQTAAALLGRSNIGPVPEGTDVGTSPQVTAANQLLGDCWKAALKIAGGDITVFGNRRTIPGCRLAGLGFGALKRDLFDQDMCFEDANLHGTTCELDIDEENGSLEMIIDTKGPASTPLAHAPAPLNLVDDLSADVAALSLAGLKQGVAKAGIDTTGFVEKQEFMKALTQARCDEVYLR